MHGAHCSQSVGNGIGDIRKYELKWLAVNNLNGENTNPELVTHVPRNRKNWAGQEF